MVEVGAIAGIGEGYNIAAKWGEGREGRGTLHFLSAACEFPVTGGGNVEHITKGLCNNFVLFCISEKMNFYSVVKMLPVIKTMCLVLAIACARDPGNGRWVRRNIAHVCYWPSNRRKLRGKRMSSSSVRLLSTKATIPIETC